MSFCINFFGIDAWWFLYNCKVNKCSEWLGEKKCPFFFFAWFFILYLTLQDMQTITIEDHSMNIQLCILEPKWDEINYIKGQETETLSNLLLDIFFSSGSISPRSRGHCRKHLSRDLFHTRRPKPQNKVKYCETNGLVFFSLLVLSPFYLERLARYAKHTIRGLFFEHTTLYSYSQAKWREINLTVC